jgi:8-oxo-dGTP pyrophosphatase MutT (NUDIX family)
MLQGRRDWQEAVARALAQAPRPISGNPRFMPRDSAGGANLPRYERSEFPTARAAATLLLLYPGDDGELTIPLTVRHADLRDHAGEVSLPGGAVDPADASPADAARREAWEELGVDPASVRILGALDDIWIPVSNFELRPFVGGVDARPAFRPHDAEVTEVVELPLRLVVTDEIVQDEEFTVRDFRIRAGVYHYAGQRIWGATARTLAMFAAVVTGAGLAPDGA